MSFSLGQEGAENDEETIAFKQLSYHNQNY